jgi:hypothetical protein
MDINVNWIFLSKGNDEYVSSFAQGCNSAITDIANFNYDSSKNPIVVRGILKYKIMRQCWASHRDFYYMDSGYFGNNPNPLNPQGWKVWHRIVKNNLQHGDIITRPDDRWKKFNIELQPRKYGSKIIVAAPDEKPCKFYNINQQQWINETVETIKKYTDRPVVVRERAANRIDRIQSDPLNKVLHDDVHAVVTFNSVAAVESVMLGVPAFTLAPANAAAPVAGQDLSLIETPYWADQDKLYAWACHLAYGQFHNNEMRNGTALKILKETA